jgi:hypothetical protein
MRSLAKYCLKAFLGGCFSTIGAIVVLATLLALYILYPQNVLTERIRELPEPELAIRPNGMVVTPGKNPYVPITPQLEELPKIDIWMTPDLDPTGLKIDSVRNDKLTHLHVWIQSNVNSSIPFTIWVIGATINEPFGPNFTTNTTGEPMSVGQFASLMKSGSYRLEVRVGTTKVGELSFKITDN